MMGRRRRPAGRAPRWLVTAKLADKVGSGKSAAGAPGHRAGVLGGGIHVAAGGPQAGFAFSGAHEGLVPGE